MLIKSFKNFVHYHKGIFIVFISLQLLSILSIILILSVFVGNKEQSDLYDNSIKRFNVPLDSIIFNENLSNNIQSFCRTNKDILKLVTIISEDGYRADYIYNHNSQIRRGEYFTETDFNNNTPKILLCAIKDQQKIGDYISIFDTEYEVIGFTNSVYRTVPFKSFPKNIPINNTEIILNQKPDKALIQTVENDLKTVFGNKVIIERPLTRDNIMESENLLIIAVAICIVLLSIINIAYLYQYILEKRKNQFCVMQIYGATPMNCFKYMFTEITLITTFIYIISVGISEVLYPSIIKNYLYMDFEFSFGIGNYLLLYIAYMIIVLLVFYKFIKKAISNSKPIDLI